MSGNVLQENRTNTDTEIIYDYIIITHIYKRILLMKKRAYERVALDKKVQFLISEELYPATIKNISQNGMFIETEAPLPFHSNLDANLPFKYNLKVLIDFKNDILEVPVRVKRLVKNGSAFNAMGVALIDTSQEYMDFMSGLAVAN